MTSTQRFAATAILTVALAAPSSFAFGQGGFNYGNMYPGPAPGSWGSPGAGGAAYANRYQPGFATPGSAYGYGYPWGWGGPIWDPNTGFMMGASQMVDSFGQYAISQQQSKILGQQAQQMKYDTRRKQIDEWLYERSVLPTEEDERERARMQQLRRSMGDPPVGEIWTGQALNDVLKSIQGLQGQGVTGPYIPLNDETLRHINVIASGSQGNTGLLKDGGKLTWPFPLTSPAFAEDRQKMEGFMSDAVREAMSGPVKFETLQGMLDSLDALDYKLKGQVNKLTTNQFIQGRRYVNELKSAAQALQDNDVSNYVTKKWSARGDNIAALVADMRQNGLTFAPATSQDRSYYVALHRSLVDYAIGMQRSMGSMPGGRGMFETKPK